MCSYILFSAYNCKPFSTSFCQRCITRWFSLFWYIWERLWQKPLHLIHSVGPISSYLHPSSQDSKIFAKCAFGPQMFEIAPHCSCAARGICIGLPVLCTLLHQLHLSFYCVTCACQINLIEVSLYSFESRWVESLVPLANLRSLWYLRIIHLN